MDQQIEVFRLSFTRLFTMITVWSLPTALVVIGFTTRSRIHILILLFGVAGGALVGYICTMVIVAYQKVYVHLNYVRGYNVWGLYYNLDWIDIEVVRLFNFLGLKFIRLYSKRNSRVIWIPLFLEDMDRFKEFVAQYTKPDNPLAQYFDQIPT